MLRYNIPGPIDEPQDTNSGLELLPTNNTLIAMPFKGDKGPKKPELVPKDFATSTQKLMEYAQPEVSVKLKTGNEANPEVTDTISFQGGIEAFSPKSIKSNSKLLRQLEAEFNAGDALVDRIDKNAMFRKALDDNNGKAAILSMFKSIIEELEANMPSTEES